MRDSRLGWNLRRVVKYLDRIYPHIGVHCPYFALEVVLFSAAVLQDTDIDALSQFTGCPGDFVEDIAWNMENNNLWVDRKYDCSRWLSDGRITDDDRFCEEASAAEGSLWFPSAKTERSVDPLSSGPGRDCHLFWESLVCHRNLQPTQFLIYFAHSPEHGPGYRIYSEDDIAGAGGIHALEMELRQETYWFACIGSTRGVERPSGVGFDEKTVSDLGKPGADWHILRRNAGRQHPAFGGNDLELCIFDSMFWSLETYLDSWRHKHRGFVEHYAIKKLEITKRRLSALANGLRAMGSVNDLVTLTVLKYKSFPPLRRASTDDILRNFPLLRDADHNIFDEFTIPRGPSAQGIVNEFPLTIPLQLRWSTNGLAVATDVRPIFSC